MSKDDSFATFFISLSDRSAISGDVLQYLYHDILRPFRLETIACLYISDIRT
jgi:hypothetical protein